MKGIPAAGGAAAALPKDKTAALQGTERVGSVRNNDSQ
jgi:hypothetical protein